MLTNTRDAPLPFSQIAPKTVHFIGIGGIGMSGLSQWFLTQNWAVSGSELASSRITHLLQKLGVKVKIGHKKANIPKNCGLVVYTQAIKPANPELKEARYRQIKTLSYPQAVAELTRLYKTIAVSGMHGKSTTTALTALILAKAGFNPTVIIGTNLKEFGGKNFRSGLAPSKAEGESSYFVLETDEYRNAFLNYFPTFIVATNIDKEHLDFFKNLVNIKTSFLNFFSRVRDNGTLVLNKDSEILFSLKPAVEKIAKRKKLKIIWYSLKNKESKKIKKIINISGVHNISNALAALQISKVLKIPERTALKVIAAYRGSWRRMEYRGTYHISHITYHIYDDYAHHPTEIKVTLSAFREKFPNKKIICVFQPHQAERLKALFREFQSAFDEAGITLILPIFQVPGRDKIYSDFTSEKLVQAIQKKEPKKLVFYLKNPRNLKKALKTLIIAENKSLLNNSHHSRYWRDSPSAAHPFVDSHYILVMMGAGDIYRLTDSLVK